MNWYLLEPHDPLMVRDGRPFGLDTEGARSLNFPPPSVVAGTLRSRIGFAKGRHGQFSLTAAEAKAIQQRGPLLVRLEGGTPSLLLPAPRDVVYLPAKGGWTRHALAPTTWVGGDSSLPNDLRPVGAIEKLPSTKPAKHPPAFWTSSTLQQWLAAQPHATSQLDERSGRRGLDHELRTHVAIDPATGTASDGKLFRTDGLRFSSLGERLALLAGCSEAVTGGLATLGGERRLSALSETKFDSMWDAPAVRARARVVLLTPARFERGAVPTHIEGARVVAAAVPRAQVISGWDLEKKGPKATRRFAAAGSVYWVEIDGDPAQWACRVHWHEISDDSQDRLDGFGLAVVGVWNEA